jgi:hypothetical protein
MALPDNSQSIDSCNAYFPSFGEDNQLNRKMPSGIAGKYDKTLDCLYVSSAKAAVNINYIALRVERLFDFLKKWFLSFRINDKGHPS